MNTILIESSRMPFHTNLKTVFDAIGGRQREFNWLLTDVELNVNPPRLQGVNRDDATWIDGAELTDLVTTNDVQFIWAVLSGFRRGMTIDLAALEPYPFADGNRALWLPDAKIQHPLAAVEIVCWDASATILLTSDDDLTRRFRAYFPEAVDLNEYNRRLD